MRPRDSYKRITPKDVDPKLVERFMELAPVASKWAKRMTGGMATDKGIYGSKDELINEAYVYGHWWRYGDRTDGFLLTIIKYDMVRRIVRWHHSVRDSNHGTIRFRRPSIESLEALMDDENDDGFDVEDPRGSASCTLEDADLVDHIMRDSKLTSDERSLIRSIYWGGKSISEWARHGKTQTTRNSYHKHATALTKLRAHAERHEND